MNDNKYLIVSYTCACFYRGTWLEGLAYGLTNIVIFEVWWSTYYCTIISLLPNITKINNIKPMNKWYLAYLFMWTIWGKEQHRAHVQAHIQHHSSKGHTCLVAMDSVASSISTQLRVNFGIVKIPSRLWIPTWASLGFFNWNLWHCWKR